MRVNPSDFAGIDIPSPDAIKLAPVNGVSAFEHAITGPTWTSKYPGWTEEEQRKLFNEGKHFAYQFDYHYGLFLSKLSAEVKMRATAEALTAATSACLAELSAMRRDFEAHIDAYLADYAQAPTPNSQRWQLFVDWQRRAVAQVKVLMHKFSMQGVLANIATRNAFSPNWSEDQRLTAQVLIGSIAFLVGMKDPWFIGPRPIGMKPYSLGF